MMRVWPRSGHAKENEVSHKYWTPNNMHAATESTNVYPRNRVMTTLMVANTMLFAFCGLVNLTGGKAIVSLLWFCGAVLFYINFLWSKKTPFIQFSEEGLVLFPAMMRPQRMVNWSDIAFLQKEGEKKIFLVLKNGERIKIALFSINKEDRIPFVRRIESELAPKG